MKVATYNVNSIRQRLPIVLDWIGEHKPDVMCLQETKVQDQDFPADTIRKTGYHVAYRGMQAYNGVATLTRRDLFGGTFNNHNFFRIGNIHADRCRYYADDTRYR